MVQAVSFHCYTKFESMVLPSKAQLKFPVYTSWSCSRERSSAHSCRISAKMQVSGYLQVSAALRSGKQHPVSFEQKAAWIQIPVGYFGEKKRSCLRGDRTKIPHSSIPQHSHYIACVIPDPVPYVLQANPFYGFQGQVQQ